MNKEILITAAIATLGFALVMVVRDNLPKGSFNFKKAE